MNTFNFIQIGINAAKSNCTVLQKHIVGASSGLGIFRGSFLKEVIFELMLKIWIEITRQMAGGSEKPLKTGNRMCKSL